MILRRSKAWLAQAMLMVTLAVLGAVQVHQIDLPPLCAACSGSPVSAVASAFEASTWQDPAG